MRNFVVLAFVLTFTSGCTSSIARKAEPALPQTGFAGWWETANAVDTGPTIGTAKVRLEVDPNGGEWRVYWRRPDGSPRAGMGGRRWASQDENTVLLHGSGGGELRVELIDARTVRCAVFENLMELHRVDRRG